MNWTFSLQGTDNIISPSPQLNKQPHGLTTEKRQGKGCGTQRKEELLLTEELVKAATNEAHVT